MKRTLLLASALLAFTAASAQAQLNLAWNDCLAPNGTGVTNMNFACDNNAAAFNIYASVIAPAGTVGVTGEQGVVGFQSAGTTLAPWWQFIQPGSCRSSGSLDVSYIAPPPTGCMTDYFGSIPNGPLGGFAYDWGGSGNPPVGGNRARIKTVSAIDYRYRAPMTAGAETYIFTIELKATNTVGAGACAGCDAAMCIVFDSCLLTQAAGVGDFMLIAPATSSFVSWQGGAVGAGPFGSGCPGATPSHSATWGQVKSLYR